MSDNWLNLIFAQYVQDSIVPKFIEVLREEIENPQFEWDSITVRKNGEVVSSPRNAVDTGELRDSLIVDVEITDSHTVTMWATYTADHAVDVYYGYVDDYGNIKAGRDWITPAVERLGGER